LFLKFLDFVPRLCLFAMTERMLRLLFLELLFHSLTARSCHHHI
jgi:hypothetical protein